MWKLLTLLSVCLLWACLDAPAPPDPANDKLQIQILDQDGKSKDTLLFSSYDSVCFHVGISDSAAALDLVFSWKVEEYVFDSLYEYCPGIVPGSSGSTFLYLTATDVQGHTIHDSILLFVNTPPILSTERSSFIPAEDTTIAPIQNSGVEFRWQGYDYDENDELSYLLRIGIRGKWTDSIVSTNSIGIDYPKALQPSTTYQWQVVIQDWAGARDSTPIFHFETQASWQEPWVIKGIVHPALNQKMESLLLMHVIAKAPNGDSLLTPIDSSGSFQIYLGPQSDSVDLYLWDERYHIGSDTIKVLANDSAAVVLSDSLRLFNVD